MAPPAGQMKNGAEKREPRIVVARSMEVGAGRGRMMRGRKRMVAQLRRFQRAVCSSSAPVLKTVWYSATEGGTLSIKRSADVLV